MDRRDGRGQLLLVAALGLAVAFVVLALVLNAVVYTENLATRNHGQTDDVLGYERGAESAVGGLVAASNRENHTDYGTLGAALEADVATWDENASVLAAAGGHVTEASVAGVENGTRVLQSDRRAFTNAAGDGDWTAATGADGTRRFHVVATPTSSTDPLTFTVADGTASWSVRVAADGGATDVTVSRNGSQVAAHTHGADTVSLDLTEGTVNGTSVENWTYAEGVTPSYDLAVEHGGNAEGRYVFVVDRPRPALLAALPGGTYEDAYADASPRSTPAIYRADVAVSAVDDRVTYATNASVAPESGPDDPVPAA
ncbi:hypothetical protein [Halobacterium yunchengense]|uniref:hypothetical protein n=1 Tax=Halobacterium yunchengense TaxID=3108497 RepID=UPI003009984F